MPITSDDNKMCCLCSEAIKEAEVMSPLMAEETAQDQKYHLVYAHPGCVKDEHFLRIPVCKHWQTKGVCVYQSSCQFRHPAEEAGSLAKKRGRHGTWKRRRVYNEGRCSAVRRWLLNVLGRDYLMEGGCLDIAGGKGEFSFEVMNLNGIVSTVFDPRPLDLYRFKRKLEFGFYHRNDVLGCYNHFPALQKGDAPRLPNHIRGFFEMFVSGSLEGAPASEGSEETVYPLILRSAEDLEFGLDVGQSIAWSTKGLIHEDEDDSVITSMRAGEGNGARGDEFNGDVDEGDTVNDDDDSCSTCSCSTLGSSMTASTLASGDRERVTLRRDVYSCSNMDHRVREFHEGNEIKDLDAARVAVGSCSVLVGMHPDQAAEHLVDFALLNKKPFVLVPCCVYHKQFPHRRLPNGEFVKRYGELIEYLLNKSPDIHALQMDFEGKNIMLYYLGGREPLSDPDAALSHVTKGVATPHMWWALSSSVKKGSKSKKGDRAARELRAKKHREANRHDSTFVMKKAPNSFEMAADFTLSFFEEGANDE